MKKFFNENGIVNSSVYSNPVNCMSLDDLVFFSDLRLSKYNVYQFTVVSPFIDDVLNDIVVLMRRYSKNQLIQDVGCDFCKLTFVSSVNCEHFYKLFNSVLGVVSSMHDNCCLSVM